MAKVTIQQLQKMKEDGEKISMVTAYDFSQAVLVEKAGIELILVGDSLAMTTLGHEGTTALTTDEMIAHIRPVVKGAPSPMVIGDLVFGSYNESISQAIHSSNRLIKEGGCDAVKLEGAHPDIIRAIVDAGIAVQGHLGLTPQTAVLLGGFKVQGKGEEGAARVLAYATHAVLSGQAVERIRTSEIDQVVVTDTIPTSPEAAACPNIRVVSIAGLLAETLRRINNEESVSYLFME